VTEDTIRELALPQGWVDVKVCAVSDVWSGLKLVVRKERTMKRSGALAAALTLGAAAARSSRCSAAPLVDVKALAVLPERTVVVEANAHRACRGGLRAPPGATVIDLRSHTCMPGLIDLHVHLDNNLTPASFVEQFTLNPTDHAIRAVANAETTLMAGFTSVRDLGSDRGVQRVAAQRDRQGHGEGPARASRVLHHLDRRPWRSNQRAAPRADGHAGPADGIVSGADEARRAVRLGYKEGYDLIKIATTGGVLSLAKSGDAPLLVDEELAAIVATARDYRFAVACHAHGAAGMKRAIRAGVTSIEHGTYLDDEAMALMKQHGTWYVPTISAGRFVADKAKTPGFFPDIVRPKAETIGALIQGTFTRAYRAGVKIAFGTDQGVGPHGENAKEFQYMVEGGMPPLEAIRAATLYGATVMGWADRLGTLEPGKLADIVAVPGDPVRDIA
jgi:imidazolonepropionase-like amidohydrolase